MDLYGTADDWDGFSRAMRCGLSGVAAYLNWLAYMMNGILRDGTIPLFFLNLVVPPKYHRLNWVDSFILRDACCEVAFHRDGRRTKEVGRSEGMEIR